MRRPILLAVMIVSLGGVAACAYAQHRAPMRGEKIDIGGGRKMRMVCKGERGPGPTVVFESGAFGTAATWAIVQDRLAPRMRACAYDRAGLGLSLIHI